MSDKLGEDVETSVIGSRTLHRNTKEILDRVEAGDSLLILRHGRPAAAIVPVSESRARAIAVAGSPQLRDRLAEARGEHEAPAEPFAIAAQEVDEELPPSDLDAGHEATPLEVVGAELSALSRETSRLLALAAQRLAEHERATSAPRSSAGEDSVSILLLRSQQQSANAALENLLGVIRVQNEALEVLAEPRAAPAAPAAANAARA
jgi:prevent-host-death family protein